MSTCCAMGTTSAHAAPRDSKETLKRHCHPKPPAPQALLQSWCPWPIPAITSLSYREVEVCSDATSTRRMRSDGCFLKNVTPTAQTRPDEGSVQSDPSGTSDCRILFWRSAYCDDTSSDAPATTKCSWTTPVADRHSQLTRDHEPHRAGQEWALDGATRFDQTTRHRMRELNDRVIYGQRSQTCNCGKQAGVLLTSHRSSHQFQIVKDGMDPDSTSCDCEAHAVRKQTIGGDTPF